MSLNQVIILGRLGQDPDLRHTPSGAAVCSFSVATSEKFKKDGEVNERTEWHKVVTWNKTAELCSEYLKKGSQCLVNGKLQTRQYMTDTNENRYITEILGTNVQFLSRTGGDNNNNYKSGANNDTVNSGGMPD